MRIRFWGCRGSIPRSRPDMVRYGGNTSCVEVRSDGGTLVVLDFGSGAQDLGQDLLATGSAGKGHAFITHTHWDHIQGFPFFTPLFIPGNSWDIYGPRGLGGSLRETLSGQMQYQYFPVTLEQMAAEVTYHDLVEGAVEVEDFVVQTQYLNHPALTLGYRLRANGCTFVYATDHEPFDRRLAVEGYRPGNVADDRHVNFVADADLLVHDAQYTIDEYPSRKGWGHSTIEFVVDAAMAGRVRRLALFHHDPMRDDDALDRLVDEAGERVHRAGSTLEVFAAADRQIVELEPGKAEAAELAKDDPSASYAPALEDEPILLALSSASAAVSFSETLREDGLRVTIGGDNETVQTKVQAEHPSLLIVERHLPDGDALDTCRAIRRMGDWGCDVPFIVVASSSDHVDRSAGQRAGVTDWLVEPYTAAYARTRIRAGLLRAACRWQCAPAPEEESTRLAALHASGVLDTPPEERFDRITRIAAQLFNVPVALVSLVDENRQWFKSRVGLDADETPRDQAFCAHAIHRDDVMLVPDALQDDRFADNPLVVDEPHVRFYAGCPIALGDGSRVGTLCLIDHRARNLDDAQIRMLRDLGGMVEREIAESTSAGGVPREDS
ncbi:MAG: MBL fold metallo-hydrolase [Acidobacteriota bacterium]|nr:MBL fold metallo-hydrolase [Acidobacteriota bacterium]MDH3783999.1 MBL fold metallo-hydrolase [Acidobacteriota bacterium]